ncbi:MAG: amidase family protein [Kiritimatiellaeota bacterium]|nr:amidase family protein [Kiritimatiellota bacterium]
MDISGLLQGVPVKVLGQINVKDKPCTYDSKTRCVSLFDATVVARLRQAGASVVTETTYNNPSLKIRCDTGGRVCREAEAYGCVGLKPSYGRVSRYGVIPYASSMDQVGMVVRTVGDAADLLQVMAGHDPLDGTSANLPVPDYRAALQGGMKGLRIGFPKEYFEVDMGEEVRKAVENCGKAGAEIVEVNLPHTEYAVAVYTIILAAERATNLGRFDGVRYGHRTAENVDSVADLFAKSRGEGFDAEEKQSVILGTYLLGKACYERYFVQAQKVRALIRRDFEEAFKKCDVMMMPVRPTLALCLTKRGGERWMTPPVRPAAVRPCINLERAFTVPASLAGICGLSVPCGKTKGGQPVGLQILGPAFGEELILRAAYAYEQEVRS